MNSDLIFILSRFLLGAGMGGLAISYMMLSLCRLDDDAKDFLWAQGIGGGLCALGLGIILAIFN